ncbi:MAG: hypothetical protein ABIX37_05130 [Gammaproteobacteria bacterium]
MINRMLPRLAILVLAEFSLPAVAGDFSLGATASTLGFGVEGGYAFNDRFGVRLGGYAFSMGQDGEESGIEYDGDLDLSNVGAFVDWHPFAGAFRVSVGWFATDNGLDAVGTPGPGGTYEIGGETFTEAEVGTLRATADLGSSAPFLGAGWLWGKADGGLAWSLDLGLLFQDSPDIELTSTGGTLSNEAALQDALADEEAELEDDIDQYDLYPVVSFGVSYRF